KQIPRPVHGHARRCQLGRCRRAAVSVVSAETKSSVARHCADDATRRYFPDSVVACIRNKKIASLVHSYSGWIGELGRRGRTTVSTESKSPAWVLKNPCQHLY